MKITLVKLSPQSSWLLIWKDDWVRIGLKNKKKYISFHFSAVLFKGQLISKAIYGLLTSPKKRTDEFVSFPFLIFAANKSNSPVRFLGESRARQSAFRFYLAFKICNSSWGFPARKVPKKVPVVARICWTCLFQATHLTSSKGWALAPGVIGVENLFKSQMETSESEAPEANKLAWKGLRSKEFTEPVCLLLLEI